MTPSITQSNILTQLGKFLQAVLPGVVVMQGQPNRIPEPVAGSFVVMWPTRQRRLRTNIDTSEDSKFTGAIAGTTMTVTAFDPVLDGAITVGSAIFGVGVADNTFVTALGTGTGGLGTYTITPSQTLGSRTLSAGQKTMEQGIEQAVQLEFHGTTPAAGDMAAAVTTAMRDAFAVENFASQTPNYGVVPLYADDARQTPFFNDQQQIEWRWIVEAMLQANVVISVSQQYADSATIETVDVDVEYPA